MTVCNAPGSMHVRPVRGAGTTSTVHIGQLVGSGSSTGTRWRSRPGNATCGWRHPVPPKGPGGAGALPAALDIDGDLYLYRAVPGAAPGTTRTPAPPGVARGPR